MNLNKALTSSARKKIHKKKLRTHMMIKTLPKKMKKKNHLNSHFSLFTAGKKWAKNMNFCQKMKQICTLKIK